MPCLCSVDCISFICCRVSDSELDKDPAANLLTSASEEAQKVARNEGKVQHMTQHTAVATTPVMGCLVYGVMSCDYLVCHHNQPMHTL